MKKVDWTDFQYLISVAKLGSLSAAARYLGVNHSTVLRRINAFENDNNIHVFLRTQQGYELSRHGKALLHDIEKITETMESVQRRVAEFDSKLEGELSITTTDNLFDAYVSPHVVQFAQAYPGVKLNMFVSSELVDISQLEADIAIRPAAGIPQNYFGSELFEIDFEVFGTEQLISELGGDNVFEQTNWIGFSGTLSTARVGKLFEEKVSESNIRMKSNSFAAIARTCGCGLGFAVLPSHLTWQYSQLRPVPNINQFFKTSIYIMAHDDLVNSSRVKACIEFFKRTFNSLE